MNRVGSDITGAEPPRPQAVAFVFPGFCPRPPFTSSCRSIDAPDLSGYSPHSSPSLWDLSSAGPHCWACAGRPSSSSPRRFAAHPGPPCSRTTDPRRLCRHDHSATAAGRSPPLSFLSRPRAPCPSPSWPLILSATLFWSVRRPVAALPAPIPS